MAASGRRVNVGSAAPTLLFTAPTDAHAGQAALIRNRHATLSIDLGGDAVTSGAGYELLAGEAIDTSTVMPGDRIYAIAPAGQTVTVHILETGV